MSESTDTGDRGSFGWACVLILVVALALRGWEAIESSLWLDELHTLHHASQATLSAVSESVRRDNHTPVYFWIVHLFGDWSEGAALRWISVGISVIGLFVLMAILAEAGASRPTRLLTAFLYATIPYQVHYGAELRPYPLLAVWTMGAFWCAFARRGPAWTRFLGFALCVVLGLLTHRSMALSVFAIGLARLFVRPAGILHLGLLILAGGVFALPFLPWLVSFAEQASGARQEHLETIGGYVLRDVLRNELMQLPLRVVEPILDFLGRPWRDIAFGATVVFFLAVAVAFGAWLRPIRGSRQPLSYVWRAALIYGVAVFVLTTGLSWYSWDRVPLQYYVGMAWVVPIVLAEPIARAAERPIGRVAAWCTVASVLVMGIAMAGGTSRADMRGAVELLETWGRELEAAGERPLYTARLAQPGTVFPDCTPFKAYAPDLPTVEPGDVPRKGDPDFERPLLVLRRVLSVQRPQWAAIREGRRIVRQQQLDWYIWVYEWRPEAPETER